MQIYLHFCSADNLYRQICKKALSVVLYCGAIKGCPKIMYFRMLNRTLQVSTATCYFREIISFGDRVKSDPLSTP